MLNRQKNKSGVISMRKYAFLALIMLTFSILAGCGGGGGSSTLIVSTNESFVQASVDSKIAGKTLYFASTASSTPITLNFGAGATGGSLTIDSVSGGTWGFNSSTGELTISHPSLATTTNTMVLKRIQVESLDLSSEYWLVYDVDTGNTPANKVYRLYADQTAASTYLASIFNTASTYLLGGTIQGANLGMNDLPDGATADVNNVSTYAGSNINTPATTTGLNHPIGITSDKNGVLYVADTANHVIRKVDIAGNVTLFAGVEGTAGSADSATNSPATFSSPQGITTDGTYLYVTDTGNSIIRRIEMVAPFNVVTFAGIRANTSAIDSTTSGISAQFYQPVGITNDGTNLYVTDAGHHTIRKIKLATVAGQSYSQSVTTLAGYPNLTGATDGTSTDARFNTPLHITTDGTNLYVTDFSNHTIRKVVIATGATSTIAGSSGVKGESINGQGTSARFYYPSGITTDGTNLYVTEFNDTTQSNPVFMNLIRKVVLTTGVVTTIAGGSSSSLESVDTSAGVAARFSRPLDIVSNGTSLFVTNYSNGYTDAVTQTVYPSFNNIRRIGP
jgi:hypothetical protein